MLLYLISFGTFMLASLHESGNLETMHFYGRCFLKSSTCCKIHTMDMIGCCGTALLSLQQRWVVIVVASEMLIIWPPQLPLPPLPPSSPTTITTTMPAHYDINVMSIFVEMGGFEHQTAMLLKQSPSWHPGGLSLLMQCRVVQRRNWSWREKEGCSWRKCKARTQNCKPEMKQTRGRKAKQSNRFERK